MSTDNKKLKESPRITDTSVTDKGEIRIQWTAVPMAEKYAVKRSEKPDGSFEVVGKTKVCEYTDKTPAKNVTYWYRVVAIKDLANKKTSKKESSLAAQLVSEIPAPDSLSIKCSGNKIKLKWKKVSADEVFRIYRRSEHFNQLLPVGEVNQSEFTDKGIVSGQIYYYSVQSITEKGQSKFSKELSCVTLDCGEIIFTKARLFKKVDLKARIVAGADGYIFERSEDGKSFSEISRTDSSVNVRYTDMPKKAFKTVYYRVRAYKNIGGEVFISTPSKAVTVKTK